MKDKQRRQAAGKIWQAMTGQAKPGPVTDPREAITTVYGRNSRGNPDAAAAAQELGVSASTVRRWINTDPNKRAQPRGDNAETVRKLNTRATRRRNASSEYRAQQTAAQADRAAKSGATIKVAGQIRTSSDVRSRSIPTFQVSPEQAQSLYKAFNSGNTSLYEETLEEAITSNYFYGAVPAELLSLDSLKITPMS